MIEIHHRESRAAVENTRKRAHQRGEQGGHDEPFDTRRKKLLDHCRIHAVGVCIAEKDCAGESGQHENEDGQDFQEPGKDGCAPRGFEAVGRECTLNDHLVRAPVPDAEYRCAEDDAGPWKIGIAQPFPYREERGGQFLHQAGETADFRLGERHKGQDGAAADEDETLDEIRIDHGAQPAEGSVYARSDEQDDRSDVHVPAEDRPQHERPCINRHADLGEDVGNEGDGGKIVAAAAVVAAFEELGHREDAGAEIEGNEEPAEYQEDETREPLELAHGESARGAAAGEADEMLSGNIRREETRADGHPADASAAKKIGFGVRLAFLAGPPTDQADHAEVREQYDAVENRELSKHWTPPVPNCAHIDAKEPPVQRKNEGAGIYYSRDRIVSGGLENWSGGVLEKWDEKPD